MLNNNRKTSAFTLIEILVVMALVSILAAITIVAINPAKTFADARNTQRQSDVREILSGMILYLADQGHAIGDFGTITVCPTKTAIGTDTSNIDLSTTLVSTYLDTIPTDPSVGNVANTGYTVCQTNGRLQIDAPNAENGKTINIKR